MLLLFPSSTAEISCEKSFGAFSSCSQRPVTSTVGLRERDSSRKDICALKRGFKCASRHEFIIHSNSLYSSKYIAVNCIRRHWDPCKWHRNGVEACRKHQPTRSFFGFALRSPHFCSYSAFAHWICMLLEAPQKTKKSLPSRSCHTLLSSIWLSNLQFMRCHRVVGMKKKKNPDQISLSHLCRQLCCLRMESIKLFSA